MTRWCVWSTLNTWNAKYSLTASQCPEFSMGCTRVYPGDGEARTLWGAGAKEEAIEQRVPSERVFFFLLTERGAIKTGSWTTALLKPLYIAGVNCIISAGGRAGGGGGRQAPWGSTSRRYTWRQQGKLIIPWFGGWGWGRGTLCLEMKVDLNVFSGTPMMLFQHRVEEKVVDM